MPNKIELANAALESSAVTVGAAIEQMKTATSKSAGMMALNEIVLAIAEVTNAAGQKIRLLDGVRD
jgi:hypothetical protein